GAMACPRRPRAPLMEPRAWGTRCRLMWRDVSIVHSYLRNAKRVSRSSTTIALCAFTFLYQQTSSGLGPCSILSPHQIKLPVLVRAGAILAQATSPRAVDGVQRAFRAVVKASGLHKIASVPTLRHSWATDLFEAGVKVRIIQVWIGTPRRPARRSILISSSR